MHVCLDRCWYGCWYVGLDWHLGYITIIIIIRTEIIICERTTDEIYLFLFFSDRNEIEMSARVANNMALKIITTMLSNPHAIPETIVNELHCALGGSGGYVFVNKGENDKVTCIFSADRRFYTVNSGYHIDELPDTNQMNIFHRNDLIGIVSFAGETTFEEESYEELVQNVICVALMRHANIHDTGHFFETGVYKEIGTVLQGLLHDVDTITNHVNTTVQAVHTHNAALDTFRKKTRAQLRKALSIIVDALDYIDFEKNAVTPRKSTFDIKDVLQQTLVMLGVNISVKAPLEGSTNVTSDQSLVRQAFVGIIKRVQSQIEDIEVSAGPIIEVKFHLSLSLKVLKDSPSGHNDLSIQLAQTICRHLGGDLGREGSDIIMMLRDLQ